MSNKIKNPHDAVFKGAFRNKQVMEDFLRTKISTELQKKVDLTTLQLENSSFVDPKLQDSESDLVYSLKIEGDSGYLYVLIECESSQRRAEHIAIRLFEYNARLMRQHVEQGRGTKFPAILNLVLYTDAKPYMGEIRLIDCFEDCKLFYQTMEYVFLIELHSKTIEEILKDGKAALVEFLLKHGKEKELANFLAENLELVQRLMVESPYQVGVLKYIAEREEWRPEKVLEKFPNLAEEIKNEFMSGIQQVRQDGMKEGIMQGKLEVIQGMFAAGADLPFIVKSAKLPESEIKEILGIDGKRKKKS